MGFLLEGDQASGEPATVNQRVTGIAALTACIFSGLCSYIVLSIKTYLCGERDA
jgi:hypothetical protein